jgi:hypothetical protein
MVGVVSGGALLLLGLVTLALFVEFPQVMTTGDANLQRWIGPDAARLSFLGLALAVGGGASWVVWQGTRVRETGTAWWLGAATGTAAGLATAVLSLVMGGMATSSAGLQAPPLVATAALLLGPLAVGLIAAQASGRTGAGAIAGFSCALLLVLLAAVGMLAADSLFAQRLLQTAWVGYRSGDPLCSGVHGATLLGCAVGDDLGFAATLLILGPVLGLGLGTLAGLIGREFRRRNPSILAETSVWPTALRPVVLFSAFLAVVLVVELLGNLW